MYYSYNIESQLRRIIKNKAIFNEKIETSHDTIEELYDGMIYKEFLNSLDGQLVFKKAAYTMSLNTDGISICEKSKLDIWAVYLVINEIKHEYRYCIENVIVAGNFSLFLFGLRNSYF